MHERKVALITGAGSGIGAGIAELFVESGYAVVAVDISGERANAIARKLEPQGPIIAVSADITEEDQVKSAVDIAVREFGTFPSW